MKNLKYILNIVKANKLIENYTNLVPSGGIKTKFAAICQGEEPKKPLTDHEVSEIKDGLKDVVKDINVFLDSVESC